MSFLALKRFFTKASPSLLAFANPTLLLLTLLWKALGVQCAIQLGFSSVMMDGSLREDGKTPSSYEYNVDVTRKTVDMAHACGVSVEGELGCLGSLETGQAGEEDGVGAEGTLSHEQMLTDPTEAKDFVEKTNVDSTKHKAILTERFGQPLWFISTALSAFYVGHYTSKPLPCINFPQSAEKISSKGQHALNTTQHRVWCITCRW